MVTVIRCTVHLHLSDLWKRFQKCHCHLWLGIKQITNHHDSVTSVRGAYAFSKNTSQCWWVGRFASISSWASSKHAITSTLSCWSCSIAKAMPCGFRVVEYLLILFLDGEDSSSETVVKYTHWQLSRYILIILVQCFVIEGEFELWTNLSNRLV